MEVQPVSYKRYYRCNNCVLLLVYAINISLRTDLVDPYGENTFSVKPPLDRREKSVEQSTNAILNPSARSENTFFVNVIIFYLCIYVNSSE